MLVFFYLFIFYFFFYRFPAGFVCLSPYVQCVIHRRMCVCAMRGCRCIFVCACVMAVCLCDKIVTLSLSPPSSAAHPEREREGGVEGRTRIKENRENINEYILE